MREHWHGHATRGISRCGDGLELYVGEGTSFLGSNESRHVIHSCSVYTRRRWSRTCARN